jgi:membrane-associated HD superfamily phosphohydrolase
MMPRRKKGQRDSNLFRVDHASIELRLQEANEKLLEQSGETLQEAANISDIISTEPEQERAESILERLKERKKEAAEARLKDGRPFTDAVETVKKWFGKTENKLKTSERNLTKKLNIYVENQWKAHEVAVNRTNEVAVNTTDKSAEDEIIIGTDISGHSIIKSRIETNVSNQELEPEPVPVLPAPSTPVKWEVDGFDIGRLALEDLRSYFTEAAITNALKKHLKETNQPNTIQGAYYKRVADL